MAYADYEHCPGCDAKVIYTGDTDVPEDVVCWHIECLAKEAAQGAAAEQERIRRELQERKAVLAYVGTNRHVVAVLAKDIEDVLGGTADGAHTPGGAT